MKKLGQAKAFHIKKIDYEYTDFVPEMRSPNQKIETPKAKIEAIKKYLSSDGKSADPDPELAPVESAQVLDGEHKVPVVETYEVA